MPPRESPPTVDADGWLRQAGRAELDTVWYRAFGALDGYVCAPDFYRFEWKLLAADTRQTVAGGLVHTERSAKAACEVTAARLGGGG
jgi:hypothetical protein